MMNRKIAQSADQVEVSGIETEAALSCRYASNQRNQKYRPIIYSNRKPNSERQLTKLEP
jgi:hypothetical protein